MVMGVGSQKKLLGQSRYCKCKQTQFLCM